MCSLSVENEDKLKIVNVSTRQRVAGKGTGLPV